MSLINIHDVEVSISAWVSHVMPFNPQTTVRGPHRPNNILIRASKINL